ncbi:hypothetical protein [uncultured Faecalibaculum sp.]|uniref:hypothetical protein n=1 Tax=uncultured Faecalibaculum sp. TaxID=1729681 RepID=UPI00260ABD49|nr:hypothetical protein [uncultured Faecalibaculum sp.]
MKRKTKKRIRKKMRKIGKKAEKVFKFIGYLLTVAELIDLLAGFLKWVSQLND